MLNESFLSDNWNMKKSYYSGSDGDDKKKSILSTKNYTCLKTADKLDRTAAFNITYIDTIRKEVFIVQFFASQYRTRLSDI